MSESKEKESKNTHNPEANNIPAITAQDKEVNDSKNITETNNSEIKDNNIETTQNSGIEDDKKQNNKTNKESNQCKSEVKLPTAVLKRIFKYLPGRQIYKCRAVCHSWKNIIDETMSKHEKWRKCCKKEFKNIYKQAHKNNPNMDWFNLYKSLSLWPQIKKAKMTSKLFDINEHIYEFVNLHSFQIFDNKIGVHFNDRVDYFELESEKKLEHRNFSDVFSKYRENDKIVAVINIYTSRLLICPKEGEFNRQIDFQESFLEVDTNVKDFVLIDLKVYYVTESGDLYVCKITEDLKDAKKNFLKQFDGKCLALSFTNNINILTEEYDIYSLIDNEFCLQHSYSNGCDLFNNICKYDFVDNIKWNDMYKHIVSKHNESEEAVGIMWSISAMKLYGNILLVGTENGLFSIYNLSGDNLNLLTMRSAKEINIFEVIKELVKDNDKFTHDDDAISQMNIVHIDVVEIENGHNIYVATKSNIVVLQFSYESDSVKRTSTEPGPVTKRAKVQKKK